MSGLRRPWGGREEVLEAGRDLLRRLHRGHVARSPDLDETGEMGQAIGQAAGQHRRREPVLLRRHDQGRHHQMLDGVAQVEFPQGAGEGGPDVGPAFQDQLLAEGHLGRRRLGREGEIANRAVGQG